VAPLAPRPPPTVPALAGSVAPLAWHPHQEPWQHPSNPLAKPHGLILQADFRASATRDASASVSCLKAEMGSPSTYT